MLGLQGDAWEEVESRRNRDCKGCGKAALASGSRVCGQVALAEMCWRWMLEQAEKQPTICLFLCKGIHSFSPPAALVMGTNELKKLPPMQLESV